MRVLMVHMKMAINNLFVWELASALNKNGNEVVVDADEFWNKHQNYQIIHFHWPEAIYAPKLLTKDLFLKIENQLAIIGNTSRIVYTKHNEQPHYAENKYLIELYKLIEKKADLVINLGKTSINNLEKCTVIPHHIYDNHYNGVEYSKETARALIGISKKKFIVLCFGKFRDNEELKMVLKGFDKFKTSNDMLLITSFIEKRLDRSRLAPLNKLICKVWYKLRFNTKIFYGHVPGNKLPIYFSAADVVLIQRKSILNSGNLPMGFYYNKVVIGPDTGNVGETLKATGNPVFIPESLNSLVEALTKSKMIAKNGLGEINGIHSRKNWSLDIISKKYLKAYKSLLINEL